MTANTSTLNQARAAKQKALKLLAAASLNAGVGIARIGDGYGLKVNLPKPLPSTTRIPQEIDGVPLRIEVVGSIRKQ